MNVSQARAWGRTRNLFKGWQEVNKVAHMVWMHKENFETRLEFIVTISNP